MASELTVPAGAMDAQHRSSDPSLSVFVSANAGAGKTYVLARRVVRLLLAGVAPGAILCLTYTNAAAAEMAQRVFSRLAELATMEEAELHREVARLAPEADPDAASQRARTLFATTLETPGGLKIQTLHAFAAALLRRFPLEAGVSGAFAVLDDAMRSELTDRAIAKTLGKAADDPTSWVAEALAALQPYLSDASLIQTLRAAMGEATLIEEWAGTDPSPEGLRLDLERALGLSTQFAPPSSFDEDVCRELLEAIEKSGKSKAVAKKLKAALGSPASFENAPEWPGIFLTKEGEKRDSVVAPAIVTLLPGLDAKIEAETARLLVCRERLRIRDTIEASVPLVRLAADVRANLEGEKVRRGLIDYDDQIRHAASLVGEAMAAAWVRYKLDDGIDHVMVDEAQDTAPAQWDLVEALVGEFFAGKGARDVQRTMFAVGDEKQSIYSFQGAEPKLFSGKRSHYEAAAAGSGAEFETVDLRYSFRSSPEILSAVDAVFAADPLAANVGSLEGTVRHEAVRDAPGGVDVWPLFGDVKTPDNDDWDKPFDYAADNAGEMQLVAAIADQIVEWTGDEGPLGGPPVSPGEVMVLARARGTFAARMNRALKARGVPTAGADRLDVTSHIAVLDMLALGRALISTDDLSLASVLKSPLFGFDEEALFALAYGREGSLYAALASGDDRAREARATLSRWRRIAQGGRPFDLYARILIGEGRRADFAARMGSEAQDALDAFLDMALSYEASGLPTLETFLFQVSRLSKELRRVPDATSEAVRVMTVHGAKGLEAKVVFLADIGASPSRPDNAPRLVPLPLDEDARVLAILGAQATRPGPLSDLAEHRRVREEAEHHRLLYVAMTRAERHLVVCGSYKKKLPGPEMWHALVENALRPHAEPLPGREGGLAWRVPGNAKGKWPAPLRRGPSQPSRPDWLDRPASVLPEGPEPIVASGGHGGGGSTEVDDRVLAPADHGTLVHRLLEADERDRDAMASRVRRLARSLGTVEAEAVVAEAERALALPELAGADVLREPDLIGDVVLPDGSVRRATARIDRLQWDKNRVLIVDFKTDRAVPARLEATPRGYLMQLAIYRALIEAIAPGCVVDAAIVWTAAPAYSCVTELLPAVRPAHGDA